MFVEGFSSGYLCRYLREISTNIRQRRTAKPIILNVFTSLMEVVFHRLLLTYRRFSVMIRAMTALDYCSFTWRLLDCLCRLGELMRERYSGY